MILGFLGLCLLLGVFMVALEGVTHAATFDWRGAWRESVEEVEQLCANAEREYVRLEAARREAIARERERLRSPHTKI